MIKFLAVVKREYVQRVRSRMFLVVTVGAPLMFALFTVVPAMIAGMKAGGPTRIAVVDETGRMYERVRDALTNARDEGDEAEEGKPEAANPVGQNSSERMKQAAKAGEQDYAVEQASPDGRTTEELKRQLDERVKRDELDGYLVLPKNVLEGGEAQYYSRNVGDVFTRGRVQDGLTKAVRDARLAENNVRPEVMRAVNRPVKMATTKAGGGGEKADNGQGFFLVFGVGFVIFFLLGYFIYATIYALVGSMVTTTQEGGQLAMPIILLLVVGFYLVFPVVRSPNSPLAFWASMIPFFSPITMLVRITTQTPPFWQIALSLAIGFATVVLLVWLAGRVYRVGMLMYGKRATIPEVLKWIRQS